MTSVRNSSPSGFDLGCFAVLLLFQSWARQLILRPWSVLWGKQMCLELKWTGSAPRPEPASPCAQTIYDTLPVYIYSGIGLDLSTDTGLWLGAIGFCLALGRIINQKPFRLLCHTWGHKWDKVLSYPEPHMLLRPHWTRVGPKPTLLRTNYCWCGLVSPSLLQPLIILCLVLGLFQSLCLQVTFWEWGLLGSA